MRKLSFFRKPLGLLFAPLALAALPVGATTLSVSGYDESYSIYDGTDADGNRLFFYIPSANECVLIGIGAENASVTIPDMVSKVIPGTEGQEIEEINVTRFQIDSEYSWQVSPFSGSANLTDIVLPKSLTSIKYASDYPKKNLHFTSETAPNEINMETYGEMYGRPNYLVYAPEAALNIYKDAFLSSPCFVVAEGVDADEAFAQEVAALKSLIVKANHDSGIYNASWTGTDEKGVIYAFSDPSEEATFRGAITSASTLTIPESVAIVEPSYYSIIELPVTGFSVYYDDYEYYACFPGCVNLKDIYMPSHLKQITWNGYKADNLPQLHFTGSNVPEHVDMWSHEFAYGPIPYIVFAPESVVDAYREVFEPKNSIVFAEGTDPKQAYDDELAEKGLLIITPNSESGMNYVSWTGTDKNGSVFGFENPGSEVTFRGAITSAKSITIPERVCVSYPEYYYYYEAPVIRFCIDYYDEERTDFPGCLNLTDIYVPACINHAEWHGEEFSNKFNFHFSSEEAPEFYMGEGAGDNINIYVPDELLSVYAEALGSQDYILWSETPATPIIINVATPGTLAEEVSLLIKDLNEVRWLILTGTPSELDLRMLRRLPRLEILDLSAVKDLASVGGCNGLRYLREVTLPEGITSIDNDAFNGCRNLLSINIPDGVTEIGGHSFDNTGRLRKIVFPTSLKKIGSSAFRNSGLKNANLENVEEIQSSAFASTKLSNIDLSATLYIGDAAFSSSPLKTVIFGHNISNINGDAFNNCELQGELVIPEKVSYLSSGAFANNPEITKIVIHKDITSLSGSYSWSPAFYGCYPQIVECNVLFPLDYNGFGDQDMSSCELYVPALTLNEYLLHDNWLNFKNIEPLPDDLTVLDLDREYLLRSNKGIAEKADLNMSGRQGYGHLTVGREKDLNLGKYYHNADFGYTYYGATIIPESTVTADNVELSINMSRDRWYFLSLPFDVNVKDIVVDDDALWVVRKYSGEARANLAENTWQNMTDETVLKAGEGYIFNCMVENRDQVNFTFTPAANGNAIFAKDVVVKELNEYASEFAHNASWNLIGNTYPAYLNIKAIDFEAPITVWENGTYYAYSPVDDDYVLDPFQAFFVQRQSVEGGNAIAFKPEGRAHSREAAAELDFAEPQTRAGGINLNRSLFNIYVKGENGMDRTRIVVNPEASFAYEANRDASKFMSTSELVPQIFVNNNNVRMAINESPIGNGQFTLGTRFGEAGEYTISIDTRNADSYGAILIDNVTGISTDLTASPYTFNAEAGINDNRFTIIIGTLSGVESAVAEGLNVKVEGNVLSIVAEDPVEITVVTIDGKVIATDKSADFSATLEDGIYVVKAAGVTTKVNIGK